MSTTSDVGTQPSVVSNRCDHRPRILVVDDESDVRELYSQLLKRYGYDVTTAEDGQAGWDLLMNKKENSVEPAEYDLVITDHKMPGVSGGEMVNRLHAAGFKRPIIMVSGVLPDDTCEFNVTAILEKPFSWKQLLKVIKETLQPAIK